MKIITNERINRMEMNNPPHPGEVLKELYIEPLNVTVTTFARALGVRRATASSLLNGKSSISPQMAIKLSRVFNTTPDLWLGMQMEYDLWNAKQLYDGHEIQRLYG